MKLRLLTTVTLLVHLTVYAQHEAHVAARFGGDITASVLRPQLYTLAGPEMEGRETATPGQARAARYIIEQFSKAGLQPGAAGQWEQYFYLYQDTLISGSITVNNRAYSFGKDFYASVRENNNQELQASRLLFAGYGISAPEYDNYRGLDAEGQVVMILPDEPRKNDSLYLLSGTRRSSAWSDLDRKIAEAARRKAAALLVVHESAARMEQVMGDRLRRTGIYTRNAGETHTQPLNVYFISPQLAAALLGLSSPNALLGPANPKQQPALVNRAISIRFRKGIQEFRSSNVLAYLEGTDKKEEVVFVTAHYDHLGAQDGVIYYGADDDASGTVAVLQIAAAFSRAAKAGYRPRRSLVFMAVSGEEKGLLGSRYYTENPLYPLQQTVADLNIDMIGRIDPMHEKDTNYVYIIGDNKLSSALRTINERANATYTKLHLDYKYNDPDDPNRFYYRSDHYMFAQHNIPVIFYFNGTHADYHRASDTPDKIDYPLLARRAQLVFYTAWEIANREERLKVDRHEQ